MSRTTVDIKGIRLNKEDLDLAWNLILDKIGVDQVTGPNTRSHP